MSRQLLPLPPASRGPSASRTYIVVAIGGAAGETAFARPLGTIAAPHRTLAREAARALFPQVPADELRVVAAATAPAGLLVAALEADGAGALAEV